MARLTVDGIEVDVDPGRTVLQAAEEAGVKIPTLCHHRALAPYGACRVCLVEVEMSRGSRIEASCVYPAQDGLVVSTNTERVRRTRKVMVELLLARCPEARAVKELALDLGIDETRFPKKHDNCILCGLCVRVCQERMGVGAINFAHRGPDRNITTPYDKHSPICMACGACQVVCPVDVVDLSKVTLLEPRPIPSDYDMGLARRSSIYLPFAQAIPKVATIDPDTCPLTSTNRTRFKESRSAPQYWLPDSSSSTPTPRKNSATDGFPTSSPVCSSSVSSRQADLT
jgi:heterodisulfide reductase subunit A